MEKIEKLVLPLLNIKSGKYLTPPSFSKVDSGNLDLRSLKHCIEGVIAENIEKVDHKVKSMARYVKVLEKRSEELIYDLRKRTYIKQNEHLLDDSETITESEEDESIDGAKVLKRERSSRLSRAESVD